MARGLLAQLEQGYEVCAVMGLPSSVGEWRAEHRTARKRADRCRRRGYGFRLIDRADWLDDIYEINTSSGSRQGRPMSSGYWERPAFSRLPDYPCVRHAIRTSGVVSPAGRLVAYITVYRVGELVLVSQILGHAEHQELEVMWLLFEGALERETSVAGRATVVYNRWDSGTDGLRWFKERLGFRESPVEWLS